MKRDLDQLMHTHHVDALWIMGPTTHNPAMRYFTGDASLTGADLFKRRDQPPLLFYRSMERDEAAKSGLPTRCYDDYPFKIFYEQASGDIAQASALRFQKILTDLGLDQGRIALYGKIEFGPQFDLTQRLKQLLPAVEFLGFSEDPILLSAMMTKDEDEIERIRHMGQITAQVVAKTADFLSGHRVNNGILVKPDGNPLTIGEVKRKINLWLAEKGVDNPEGTIFAIGRDAAVPHSTGNPDDVLRLGETIVFDIFPCEAGGGYYYDFTRTWCLGYASDEALTLYEQVLSVYRQITQELKPNTFFKTYHDRTCELFEAMGHPTVRTNPTTQEGYVHSLGHGLGLHVHEYPVSGAYAKESRDILAPGTVFTIEPGLYYPGKGIGVRLEDTYAVLSNGEITRLAEYPLDLVIPIREG